MAPASQSGAGKDERTTAMTTKRIVVGMVLALALAGCASDVGAGGGTGSPGGGAGSKADDGTDEAGAVVIDESGDGQSFDVAQGQLVVVRLASNPTTGYDWAVTSTDRSFG